MCGCSACGGIFLGPEASVHVMRGLGDALEAEVARASVEIARSSHVPARDGGARACPACHAAMARVVVGDVVVDSCFAHGTWFDRDEVSGVVRACGTLRKSVAPPDDAITVGGIAEGAAFVVTGAASLLVRAFAGVVEVLSNGSEGGDD